MGGSAILDEDILVDDLVVDVIDSLREELQGPFGIRPYHVYRTIRTWSGQEQGEGDYTDITIELTPRPRVRQWNGYKYQLLAAGTHEDGEIMIDEVSLSYTHPEITGGTLALNQQLFFTLKDAYGNLNEDRVLRLSKPPFIDREKTMGWCLSLMDMNIPDGTGIVEPL